MSIKSIYLSTFIFTCLFFSGAAQAEVDHLKNCEALGLEGSYTCEPTAEVDYVTLVNVARDGVTFKIALSFPAVPADNFSETYIADGQVRAYQDADEGRKYDYVAICEGRSLLTEEIDVNNNNASRGAQTFERTAKGLDIVVEISGDSTVVSCKRN